MNKSVPIGLTNLVYAKLLADVPPTSVDSNDGYTTYDSVVRVSGAITANFSPSAANDTLFADDGPYEVASTLGAMTLELNVADLPPDIRSELLGETYGDDGILRSGADSVPPWVAVGMAVAKSNGYSRYIWYLKGKFTAPDDNNQTKADSINWNTPTISANMARRDSDNQYRFAIDTDDAKVDSTTKATWFESPNVATLVLVAPIVADPPGGAISKAATPSITLTCATVGAAIEYKLSSSNVWVAYSAGISTSALNGTVVINVRASSTGMSTSTTNLVYTVTA